MRLAKGIAAVACFLLGLWLMLRAAGLLTAVLSAVPRWWPALPAVVGAAILVRSPSPGPHRRVAIGLAGASGVAFAMVHHLIPGGVWPFAAGAALMTVGFVLAYPTARASSASGTDQAFGTDQTHQTAQAHQGLQAHQPPKTERFVVVFKSAQVRAAPNLARIRVYLFCGRLELDITDCLSPGSLPDEPLMIEIVACLGNVTVVAPDETVYPHKAFIMRFGRQAKGEALRDEATRTAPAVAASMAFLGSVTVPPWNQSTASPEN